MYIHIYIQAILCDLHLYAFTRWRRLIGSPKLQIIFHKRATKYRALLRKMTYKDKGSYESSPPCSTHRRYAIGYILKLILISTKGTQIRICMYEYVRVYIAISR